MPDVRASLARQGARCPLARAAARTGDLVVMAAVAVAHPPGCCPVLLARAGRRQAGHDFEAAWRSFAGSPARQLAAVVDAGQRRWRLRGESRTRATFSRPHPGDYPGRRDAR